MLMICDAMWRMHQLDLRMMYMYVKCIYCLGMGKIPPYITNVCILFVMSILLLV